uniref:Ribonuclease kappa n=2 Tax=Bursaphelenchus xylophilus TaxID=6326 RepID=A0A1I7RIS0_BURXY
MFFHKNTFNSLKLVGAARAKGNFFSPNFLRSKIGFDISSERSFSAFLALFSCNRPVLITNRTRTMAKLCPICGPKLSAFCMIMSVWGVIFLGLLGLFFHLNAVTLFPDLTVEQLNLRDVEDKYSEKAVQCWIAAGMYLVTLIVVFWQNRFNSVSIF